MFLLVMALFLFFIGFRKLIVISLGVVFFMFFFGALAASVIYWLTIFINLENLIFKFFLFPSYPILSSWDINDVNIRPLSYKSLSVFFNTFFLSFIFCGVFKFIDLFFPAMYNLLLDTYGLFFISETVFLMFHVRF